MEGVKMIESLDSVWFFSNVLSSKKAQALAKSHGDEDGRIRTKLEQSKPITQILETHQAQSPIDEILVPKSEKSKPITQILETHQAQSQIGEIIEGPKCGGGDLGSEERKRSKTRVKKNTQKNTDEINWAGYDFGLSVNEFWMLMKGYDDEEKKRFTNQDLPPFSDGLAMKKHLKLWAYAVACNVR